MKNKDIKTNAMRILEKENVKYEVFSFSSLNFENGKKVADELNIAYELMYKTIILHSLKNYVVTVLPVNKEIDLKKVAKIIGQKSVEPIDVNDIEKISGYIRGGCSPIGMKKLFPTIIHEDALLCEYIFVSGGKIGVDIKLSVDDLINITKAKVECVCKK